MERKRNGKIRLCVDPKFLNKVLKRSHYPLPVIEDILPKLAKAKVFTVVDARSGFWQIKMTEDASNLTAMATPFGRYKWLRLPFGVAPAPELFQRKIGEALEGLGGVMSIADDTLVIGEGETMEEAITNHDERILAMLRRCRERNLKLNAEKLLFRKTEVPGKGDAIIGMKTTADPAAV